MQELIVDNFAGGGGASTGIEIAIGRSVDIAINHNRDAIAMHKANHPNTKHYCEDVWTVDPVKACAGRPVALAWFSPDCKHFSKAKGGKPKDKKIRGLAWVACKWAALVRPRVIILENVTEFQTWGPLNRRHHPISSKVGQTYKKFCQQIKDLGYELETKEMIAAYYGAATWRKRFFLVARCDGKPIEWPEHTHGDPDGWEARSGLVKPWHTAADILDFSLPTPSIFGRKHPLCEKTMKRIAKGLKKFVLDDPEPFIVNVNHSGEEFRGQSLNQPLATVTSHHGFGLVMPSLIQYHGEQSEKDVRGQTVKKPLMVVDSSNRYGLITAWMMHYYGTSVGSSCKEPLGTITAKGQHIAEMKAFLIKYYGKGDGQSLKEPLHTITGKARFGLVTVKGTLYQIIDIGMRMLEPREMFCAQGFLKNYIIDVINGKKYPKVKQVAMCGNSVCPPVATALTRANLPELCGIAC